jgi:hypothetical protein
MKCCEYCPGSLHVSTSLGWAPALLENTRVYRKCLPRIKHSSLFFSRDEEKKFLLTSADSWAELQNFGAGSGVELNDVLRPRLLNFLQP